MKTLITTGFIFFLITIYSEVYPQFNPPDELPPPTFVYDVYTPKGLAVWNYASSTSDVATFAEMTQDNIAYCDSFYLTPYPNVTVIEYSTHKYNCHGYAWHKVEHGENRWIGVDNPATVKAYMYGSDKSYVKTTSGGANKKVYYTTNSQDHSAVTTSTSGVVRSKWKEGPLVEHSLTYCPFYKGSPIEYWTINPDISGSTNKLCYNVNRTFEEESITKFDVDYDWDASGYITVVSPADYGDSYTVKGNSQIGPGQVKLTVTTPSGNTGSTTKSFDVNCQPNPASVSITIEEQGGGWVDEVCPYTDYYIYVFNDDENCSTSNYDWDLPTGWTEYYSSSNMILANSGPSPEGLLEITATTICNTNTVIFSETIPEGDDCGGYYLMFSPNPSTYETILELKSDLSTFFDDDTDWELEIYNQSQVLKEKKTKIKGTQYTIQTSGWKEGIYYVRVKLKGKVKTGVLVVSK